MYGVLVFSPPNSNMTFKVTVLQVSICIFVQLIKKTNHPRQTDRYPGRKKTTLCLLPLSTGNKENDNFPLKLILSSL